MTLRDHLKQTRRRYMLCGIGGLALWAPPGLVAFNVKQQGAQPPEYWPLLVVLVLVGGVLLLISGIGQWTVRCPKCRGLLGATATSGKFCRHCSADFDTEI